VLNCRVGSLPFVYLGLPNGGNAGRLSFWQPFIDCIKSRLSGWKSKHLQVSWLVEWRLGTSLADCLIFRCLRRCLCLICVS